MNSLSGFLVLFLLAISVPLIAQTSTPQAFDASELRGHITYPDRAVDDYLEGRLDSLLEGTAVITTMLRPDGGVSSAEITSSAGPLLDSVALAAVLKHPVDSAKATSRTNVKPVSVNVRFKPYHTADSTGPADTVIVGLSKQQRERVSAYEKEPEFDVRVLGGRVLYPEMARMNGIEGKVTVRVYIEKDGTIWSIRIVQSTNELFTDAAVNAIKGVKFIPARVKDRPIATWLTIPINFALK